MLVALRRTISGNHLNELEDVAKMVEGSVDERGDVGALFGYRRLTDERHEIAIGRA